jgi:hypothetical protein
VEVQVPRLSVVPFEHRPGAGLLKEVVDLRRGGVDVSRCDGVEDHAQPRRDLGELTGLHLGDLPVARVAGPQALGGGGGEIARRREGAASSLPGGQLVDQTRRHPDDRIGVTVEIHLTSYILES